MESDTHVYTYIHIIIIIIIYDYTNNYNYYNTMQLALKVAKTIIITSNNRTKIGCLPTAQRSSETHLVLLMD